jgi:hypothetical protein
LIALASWRDTASPQCQADMDQMLNAALPFAQQMLAKHGAFAPYAVSMSAAGEIGMVAAHAETQQPVTVDVLEMLYEGLRGQSHEIRAAAIACDVKLRPSGEDAIQVAIEHREGAVLAVVLPYKKRRFGGGIEYGTMKAIPSQTRIWRRDT